MMLEVEGCPNLTKEEWNQLPEYLDELFGNDKDIEAQKRILKKLPGDKIDYCVLKGLEEQGGSPLASNPEFGAFLSKQVFETKINQLASELSKGDFEYLSSIMKVPIVRERAQRESLFSNQFTHEFRDSNTFTVPAFIDLDIEVLPKKDCKSQAHIRT